MRNNLIKIVGEEHQQWRRRNNILEQFHTHPNSELGATQSNPEHSQDVTNLQWQKPLMPNASFIILYRIAGQEGPGEYNYTHE